MSTGTLPLIEPHIVEKAKEPLATIGPRKLSVPPTWGVTLEGAYFVVQVKVNNSAHQPIGIMRGTPLPPDVSDDDETEAILADAQTMLLLKKAQAEQSAGALLRDEDVRKRR